MNVNDFDKAILALGAWREAPEDTVESMLCIGHTIVNLARKNSIGIGDAITQHRKLHGLSAEASEYYPDTRDPKFARLLRSIDTLTDQYRQDLTNGGVYYVDLSQPLTEHGKHVMATCQLCAHHGSRHFFKDKDLTQTQ